MGKVNPLWHEPQGQAKGILVLTHGAGSNASAPMLIAVAEVFAQAGYGVLRHNLAFRQERPHGPPIRANAARDRAGLEEAVESVRRTPLPMIVGGHSYGGRQATMLAADKPNLAAALMLLSYPLHPPRKPAELRTEHFPRLSTPAVFVHGERDPFGSWEEMRAALALIPVPTKLIQIAKAGHDLKGFGWAPQLPSAVATLL